jgi:hypothetical protein
MASSSHGVKVSRIPARLSACPELRHVRAADVIFDVLRLDGTDLTDRPFRECRTLLESLDVTGANWTTSEIFDDEAALFTAVCNLNLEGVVSMAPAWQPVDHPDVRIHGRASGGIARPRSGFGPWLSCSRFFYFSRSSFARSR